MLMTVEVIHYFLSAGYTSEQMVDGACVQGEGGGGRGGLRVCSIALCREGEGERRERKRDIISEFCSLIWLSPIPD
jgi:hypothetical protein